MNNNIFLGQLCQTINHNSTVEISPCTTGELREEHYNRTTNPANAKKIQASRQQRLFDVRALCTRSN